MIWVSLSWTFEGLAEPGLLHLICLSTRDFGDPDVTGGIFSPRFVPGSEDGRSLFVSRNGQPLSNMLLFRFKRVEGMWRRCPVRYLRNSLSV
jgi:hypothetical protein